MLTDILYNAISLFESIIYRVKQTMCIKITMQKNTAMSLQH